MIEFSKSAPLKSSLVTSSLFRGYREKSRASARERRLSLAFSLGLLRTPLEFQGFLAGLLTMDSVH